MRTMFLTTLILSTLIFVIYSEVKKTNSSEKLKLEFLAIAKISVLALIAIWGLGE